MHRIVKGLGGTYRISDPAGKLVKACFTMEEVWDWVHALETRTGTPIDFVLEDEYDYANA
jgi:hypothetical protein